MDPLALYGAVVATLVAAHQWRRDRLAVRVRIDSDFEQSRVSVRVVNAGHRPIRIDSVIYAVPVWRGNRFRPYSEDPRSFPDDTPLPLRLDQGDDAVKFLDRREVAEHIDGHSSLIVVVGSTGKTYAKKLPRWLVEQLDEHAKWAAGLDD